MQKKYFLIAIFIMVIGAVYAQKNPKIHKKSFFASPAGVETAKKDLSKAEKFYRKGSGLYDEALKYYLKVYKYNKASHALNYKIGICYLYSSNKKAALPYLLQSSPEVARDYYLILGRAYQYNFMLDKAKESYNLHYSNLYFYEKFEQSKRIKQLNQECDVTKNIVKDSTEVFITNLGPVINTYYDEYGAVFSPHDGFIYLTSKRPQNEPRKRVSRFKFNEQIIVTNDCLEGYAEWAIPANDKKGMKQARKNNEQTNMPRYIKISDKNSVSLAGIDHQEHRLYFYEGKDWNGDIYTTEFNGEKWSRPKKVKGLNHIAYKETTIAIAADGTTYFVSNRRGGEGGKDIYRAKRKKGHKFKNVVNLGSVINTPFDEEAVYVTADGKTLFFSSKGHPGMGGFDIYRSDMGYDGAWSTPRNMGHPINTAGNELFYHPIKDTLEAIYAAQRPGGYGGLDIYKVKYDLRKPYTIMGTVADNSSKETLPAQVTIFNSVTNEVVAIAIADSVSKLWSHRFEDHGTYSLQVDVPGYKSVSDVILNPEMKNAEILMDYELEKLKHPFTVLGTVKDSANQNAIAATLTFVDAAADTVIMRQVADEYSGKYSVTFGDKVDLIVIAEAENYFKTQDTVFVTSKIDATQEAVGDMVFAQNFELTKSIVEYTLTGRVNESETMAPVHAALSFYRPLEDEPFSIVVSDSTNGKYEAVLTETGPFLIEIEANGYFFLNETFSFTEEETFKAKNFELKKMNAGVKIVVENILFNSGKSTLKAISYAELNKLAKLLLKNPDVRIEVSGHTDNVGSASINKKISRERALTVRNYLINQGVEAERIEYAGYGFEQPMVPNDTEEHRAQNRRVEIKVLD